MTYKNLDCTNCISINEPILYKCYKCHKNICDECKNEHIHNKFKIIFGNKIK